MKKFFLTSAILTSLLLSGCASVPMASDAENVKAKSFPQPDSGHSGLYIYRDSFAGRALKKDVYLDGQCIGETADKVFFYKQVEANKTHILATESEFSPNNLSINVLPGKNYFVRQYIKMGVFVGGAGLDLVSEAEGQRVISKTAVKLANTGICSN